MSEWKTYKLGELCLKVTDGSHFSPKENLLGEKLIASVKDMNNNGIDFHKCKKISKEDFDTLVKNDCQPLKGDVLFSKDGTMGIVYYCKEELDLVLLSSIAILRPNNKIIDGNYFAYYLKNPQTNQDIQDNYKSGSALPRIVLKDFKKLDVTIPSSIEQQTAIAQILTSLDDKIELNLQMNQTLEATAQALFKEWFVNFNFPGFDGALVDGLPKGWRMGKLGEMVTIKRGGSPRPIQDFMAETGLRWLKISDVTSLNTPFVLGTKEYIKEEGLSKTTLLKTGALILSNSATPGIPKILNVDCCIHDGWLHFPTSKFSNEFLYLQFLMLRGELVQQANGSIFTNLKTDIVREFQVPIATNDVFENFDSIVKPIFNKLLNNTLEIQTLTRTRDTLLPKLMSGKIRVA